MPIPFPFDFKKPDYNQVFEWRAERLRRIRKNPQDLPQLKAFYQKNPAQFITDWGSTYDPRNAKLGLPSRIPFLLFEKQEEWIEFALERWKSGTRGETAKCRDMGVSWLVVGLTNTLCTFNRELGIGYTSYKETYVDDIENNKAFFVRLRMFRRLLPEEFRGDYNHKTDSPFCKMVYRETNSIITGEVGDDVGRGDRTAIYIVDEYASFKRANLTEASLGFTTDCRLDVSTFRGMNNPFAQKYFDKNIASFAFPWQSDPRKDGEWYEKQKEELDEVIMAQEVDMNPNASMEGKLIPSEWIESCVDAHIKLGIEPTGQRRGALDVADEGKDNNGFACGQGLLIEHVEEWSGKGGDIFESVEKCFDICDLWNLNGFDFDADGLGAGCRGDARVLNEKREQFSKLKVDPWKGSSGVVKPESKIDGGRFKNKDYFENLKAQGWWELRTAMRETHRAVTRKNYKYDPNKIISLSSTINKLTELKIEIGQVTYLKSKRGKVMIDKAPDGCKSPNLADCVMIYNAPKPGKMSMVAF